MMFGVGSHPGLTPGTLAALAAHVVFALKIFQSWLDRDRLTPRAVAIRGDEELDTLVKATISGGGVLPHIHKSLINKAGGPQKKGKAPLPA